MFAIKIRVICVTVVLTLACVLLGGCANGAGNEHTLLIYMCGSNLETEQGLAGKNIDELLAADIPAGTKVILQTGGSKTWRSHNIANDKIQRYEVRDKQLRLLEEHDNASMGSASTLQDFLTWGTSTYGSKENILIVWDHGGKSGDKICFDEVFNNDALDRTELSAALKGANLPFKFDIVVFDACYMSTLENAALMKDYARYYVASQEVVPSNGIDYQKLLQNLGKLDSENLGLSICLDYLEKSEARDKGKNAALSLIDLSQTDKMIELLNDTCNQMASLLESEDGSYKLASMAKSSAIYGNKRLSNLIDIDVFLNTAQTMYPNLKIDETIAQRREFVLLSLIGERSSTMGVSMYFPFDYDRKEMQTYLASCPIEGYAKLLKRTYDSVPAQPVKYKDKGSIASNGDFAISLDPSSSRYIASVMFTLSRQDPQNPDNYIIMGTGTEVEYDWNNLTFASNFHPTWLAFQGQHLLTSVYLLRPNRVVYSAPVWAVDENTELLVVYDFPDNYSQGHYTECCLWGGLDSNNIPSREFKGLKAGDQVATRTATGPSRSELVRQPAVSVRDDVSENGENLVGDAPLADGRYRYQFVVTDILGNNMTSDYGIFEVTGDQARLVEVQPQA